MKDTPATVKGLDYGPVEARRAGRAKRKIPRQVDLQTLLQAHRPDMEGFAAANSDLDHLDATGERWDVPVNVATDFLRTVTHPDTLSPPTPSLDAVAFLHDLLERRNCRLLS